MEWLLMRSDARKSGFDVVLGNPPWERVKLQEQEFFSSRNPAVSGAPNAAARRRAIAELAHSDPNYSLGSKTHAERQKAIAISCGTRDASPSAGAAISIPTLSSPRPPATQLPQMVVQGSSCHQVLRRTIPPNTSSETSLRQKHSQSYSALRTRSSSFPACIILIASASWLSAADRNPSTKWSSSSLLAGFPNSTEPKAVGSY